MRDAGRCILRILADLGWGVLYAIGALVLAAGLGKFIVCTAAAIALGGCSYDSLISVHYHAAPRAAPAGRDHQVEEPPTTSGPAAGSADEDDDERPQTPAEILDELIPEPQTRRDEWQPWIIEPRLSEQQCWEMFYGLLKDPECPEALRQAFAKP